MKIYNKAFAVICTLTLALAPDAARADLTGLACKAECAPTNGKVFCKCDGGLVCARRDITITITGTQTVWSSWIKPLNSAKEAKDSCLNELAKSLQSVCDDAERDITESCTLDYAKTSVQVKTSFCK